MQWSTAISNTPSSWPTCRRSTSCRTSTSKRLSGFRRVSDVQKVKQQFFAFGDAGGFGVLFCGNLWYHSYIESYIYWHPSKLAFGELDLESFFCGNLWYLILYWILYLLISSIKVGISTLGFLGSYIYIQIVSSILWAKQPGLGFGRWWAATGTLITMEMSRMVNVPKKSHGWLMLPLENHRKTIGKP